METVLEEPRLRKPLWVVTFLCLSGALTASFALYRDLAGGASAQLGEPQARIDRLRSAVRHKLAHSYLWKAAHPSELLYRKDSLQSGPASFARVVLRDGTAIDLGENSLVVIDESSNLPLKFITGTFWLRKQTEDTQISVTKEGAMEIQKLEIKLLAPGPEALILSPSASTSLVTFSWKLPSKKDQTRRKGFLQVSTNHDFLGNKSKIIEFPPGAQQLSVPLIPGSYFWRVIQEGGTSGEIRRLRVDAVASLAPSSPNPQHSVHYIGEENVTTFHWSGGEAPFFERTHTLLDVHHVLEIASEEGFKKILRKQRIDPSAGFATLRNLPDGNYFWRIKSTYPTAKQITPMLSFKVERLKKVDLQLTSPPENAILTSIEPWRFAWDTDASDADFVWELKPFGPELTSLTRQKTSNTALVLQGGKPGTYLWRVVAGREDAIQGQTNWRKITLLSNPSIQIQAPTAGSALYYWQTRLPFELKWKAESPGPCVVDLGTEPMLNEAAHFTARENFRISSTDLGLREGLYFWRVRQLDKNGETIASSKTVKFLYGTHPLLSYPEKAKPPDREEIKLTFKDEFPTLSWTPVEEAEGYEIVILDPSNKPMKRQIKETSMPFEGFAAGTYRWSLRSIDPLGRLGPAMPLRSFHIDYGKILDAPQGVGSEVR